jgi:hypothetical protein
MIAKYDFPNHTKGDSTKNKQITFGIDLTGAKVELQFKTQINSKSSFSWTTQDNSIVINNGINGVITLIKKVIDVAPATYMYDCQVTLNDGTITTYFGGEMIIEQDITN